MTGSFSPNVMHGLDAMADPNTRTSGKDEEELRKRQAGAGATGATGYTIPYQLQSGPTRYAPMAKKPGTSITAKTATRQYPTSDYEIATTYLPEANVEITVSAPVTYSTSSIENTVCTDIVSRYHNTNGLCWL